MRRGCGIIGNILGGGGGGSSRITWPYGHGEGRVRDYWQYLGGGGGGGGGASPAPPSLDDYMKLCRAQPSV